MTKVSLYDSTFYTHHSLTKRASHFLKECEWFNTILCHVRQSLYTLEESVLRGSHALSSSMNHVVIPLQYGLVPSSWLHVNWQPASHPLDSWLEGNNFLLVCSRENNVDTFVNVDTVVNGTTLCVACNSRTSTLVP